MTHLKPNEITNKARQQLLSLAEQLHHIEIVVFHNCILHSDNFRDMAAFNANYSFPKNTNPIIYCIELVDMEIKNEFLNAFEQFSSKNKLKTKSIDRINHSRYNSHVDHLNILYVGSSINNFKSRLKDHLGVKKGTRTYGLHLCKWNTDLTYSIKITAFEIKSKNNFKVMNTVVEIIEQQFWDELKPVFGKRSGLL